MDMIWRFDDLASSLFEIQIERRQQQKQHLEVVLERFDDPSF
jgi:ABC-type uncharacterized transport system substrate-binding protein